MDKEVFAPIPGVAWAEVSNYGRVRTLDHVVCQDAKNGSKSIHIYKGKILKPIAQNTGYVTVTINGKVRSVHRIVAEVFIENPENKLFVNHKDGNKKNNNADNLEWVTASENMMHAVKHNLIRFKTPALHKARMENIRKATISNYRPVTQYDVNGKKIAEYPSPIFAGRATGCNSAKISRAALGYQHTCGGYVWRYEDN